MGAQVNFQPSTFNLQRDIAIPVIGLLAKSVAESTVKYPARSLVGAILLIER